MASGQGESGPGGFYTPSAVPIDFKREHMARRFAQVQQIERSIGVKEQQVRDAKSHVKDLEKELDGLHQEHRAASRDEGDLPLLDMMGDVATHG